MKYHHLKEIINLEVCSLLANIAEGTILEGHLDEGGYTKLVRSLAGMESNIDSIGIITAENPMAQKLSKKANRERNQQLAADLRELGYGFYQVKGKYGNVEHPFVIPNISKDDIVHLGSKYRQDAIIYVEKTPEGSEAELIGTADNKYDVRSRVILPLASNVEDFFSQYKGRKFVIPFFDDVFKGKTLVKGRVVDVS
jgi:hypothetical protein